MNPLLSSNVLSNNGSIFIICYQSHNHEVIAHFLSYRLLDNPVSLSLITTLVVTKYIYTLKMVSEPTGVWVGIVT